MKENRQTYSGQQSYFVEILWKDVRFVYTKHLCPYYADPNHDPYDIFEITRWAGTFK